MHFENIILFKLDFVKNLICFDLIILIINSENNVSAKEKSFFPRKMVNGNISFVICWDTLKALNSIEILEHGQN